MTFVGLLLFGIAIGVVSGLLGIGGGVLLVPGLMLLFGFSQPEAQGTSLAVLIPPIGIFAALVYYQHGFVRLPVVTFVALGFVVGAFFGAKLVPHVPIYFLRAAIGGLMLFIGFMFVLDYRSPRLSAELPAVVGSAVAFIAARLFRRRLRQQPPREPPSAEQEYHI